MSTIDELKQLNEQKKELFLKQKQLRQRIKQDRNEAKNNYHRRVEYRKKANAKKLELIKLTSTINKTLSTKDVQLINTLADDVIELASDLSSIIRVYSSTLVVPEHDNHDDDDDDDSQFNFDL